LRLLLSGSEYEWVRPARSHKRRISNRESLESLASSYNSNSIQIIPFIKIKCQEAITRLFNSSNIGLRISGGRTREHARAVVRPLQPLDGPALRAGTESGWQSAARWHVSVRAIYNYTDCINM